jgi:hypothetical protein
MTSDMNPSDFPGDAPPPPDDASDLGWLPDAPYHIEVLPDGREAVEFGDPEGCERFNHCQGENDLGFEGTCGLVSCEDVINQFGGDVTENDIVNFAADNDFCEKSSNPAESGGTTPFGQVKILDAHGIPARVEVCDSLEDLAGRVEDGHGLIVGVNAGVLWDNRAYFDSGDPNHAIVVTGVDRDPQSGDILGFKINDSGVPPSGESNKFIDAQTFTIAWFGSESGGIGTLVATDIVRDPAGPPSPSAHV